jgi:conjugal transfer pilus assembly protein TraW
MSLKIAMSMVLISIHYCMGKNVGTVSNTYPIHEQSILEVIQHKLTILHSKGELEQHQRMIQNKVISSIERPKINEGISKALRYSSKYFDPSITVNEDIKDHRGTLIVPKGTIYNPLKDTFFGDPLLFIDGDDKNQVSWACAQKGKIVLIKGAPLILTRQLKKQFYFDQNGFLVKKLGITEVPSKVSQHGEKLFIEFISLSNSENFR